MKRSMLHLALAILLGLVGSNVANAQSRPVHRAKAPALQRAAHEDPRVFYWRHYGVNKLVPDEYIPAPAGVDPEDKTQIINIVMNSQGYEKGNAKLQEGMNFAFFGPKSASLPPSFWSQVVLQVQQGKIHRRVIHDGERAGDVYMASGSKPDANGNVRVYVEGDYPVNKTGSDLYGWELDEAIPTGNGKAVRPIIYELCRNVSGFVTPMPMQVQPAPVAVPVLPQPTIPPPTPLAVAIAVAVNNPPVPGRAAAVVHKDGFCGKGAWKCWVPALAAGAIVCALACRGNNSATQSKQSQNIPDTQVKTTGPVNTPRPSTAPTLNLAAPAKGFSLSLKF